MSAAPIEFRKYLRKFTIDDARNGINPVRLPTGPTTSELYAPPVDQYRYREKVYVEGKPFGQWSAWIMVPVVREEDGAPESAPENTAAS